MANEKSNYFFGTCCQRPSPVNPDELAKDVVKSVQAGAAMCHLHCKKRTGEHYT